MSHCSHIHTGCLSCTYTRTEW